MWPTHPHGGGTPPCPPAALPRGLGPGSSVPPRVEPPNTLIHMHTISAQPGVDADGMRMDRHGQPMGPQFDDGPGWRLFFLILSSDGREYRRVVLLGVLAIALAVGVLTVVWWLVGAEVVGVLCLSLCGWLVKRWW